MARLSKEIFSALHKAVGIKQKTRNQKKILELKRRMVYDEIDEHDNWTKRTIFGGTDASSGNKVETREITDRMITYYQTKN